MAYTRVADGQVLPAAKVNELQVGLEALEVLRPRYDPRRYGAAADGTTDDTTPLQNTINAMLTANKGGILDLSGGEYLISSTLTMTAPDATNLVGFSVIGGGRGQRLIQTADNAPHFTLVGTNIHSLTFGNFQPVWSTAANSSKTNRVVFKSTSSGDFYNSKFYNMTVSNGHYFIDCETTMNTWGISFEDIMVTASTGGFSRLRGTAGQPNNGFRHIYLGAQTMIGPLFMHNAMNAEMYNIEVNQALLGPTILQDTSGGNYIVGLLGCEGGTWTTAGVRLFYLDDSTMIADHIFLTGTCTAATNLFRTSGRGFIDINFLIMVIVPSGSGHVYLSSLGGSNLGNPNAQRGEVIFGKVRTMTGLVPWSRTTNYVAPVDVGSTSSADATIMREWNDPSRIAYRGDADVTLGAGDAMINVVSGALTTARTLTLPHGELQVSNRMFTFIKSATTTGNLVIAKSGGSVLATIAAASKGRVTVVWNRSMTNGPAYDTWTVIENTTIT